MCTFYDSHASPEAIEEAFDAKPRLSEGFRPRYNVRPTNRSFVVRLDKNGQRGG